MAIPFPSLRVHGLGMLAALSLVRLRRRHDRSIDRDGDRVGAYRSRSLGGGTHRSRRRPAYVACPCPGVAWPGTGSEAGTGTGRDAEL
jgi:hypothetical protein